MRLYVHQLRRLLAGNGAEIVTRGRGYELRLADRDVDAIRFERLLDAARPREALALWRGEPRSDVAEEPFAARCSRRPSSAPSPRTSGDTRRRRPALGRAPARAHRRPYPGLGGVLGVQP